MGEVVNLNRYRKAVAKGGARRKATENRARHGQKKAEREAAGLEAKRRERQLDGNKLEPPNESPDQIA